jgi:uncharacterized membrane protein
MRKPYTQGCVNKSLSFSLSLYIYIYVYMYIYITARTHSIHRENIIYRERVRDKERLYLSS